MVFPTVRKIHPTPRRLAAACLVRVDETAVRLLQCAYFKVPSDILLGEQALHIAATLRLTHPLQLSWGSCLSSLNSGDRDSKMPLVFPTFPTCHRHLEPKTGTPEQYYLRTQSASDR